MTKHIFCHYKTVVNRKLFLYNKSFVSSYADDNVLFYILFI